MWLKVCPKGGGDLFPDWEQDGVRVACLHGGHSLSDVETHATKARLAKRARRAVAERQADCATEVTAIPGDVVMASRMDA